MGVLQNKPKGNRVLQGAECPLFLLGKTKLECSAISNNSNWGVKWKGKKIFDIMRSNSHFFHFSLVLMNTIFYQNQSDGGRGVKFKKVIPEIPKL